MTYLAGGEQWIVVGVGGAAEPARLAAFRLRNGPRRARKSPSAAVRADGLGVKGYRRIPLRNSPPCGSGGAAGLSSGISTMVASVVSIKPAIEAAFCRAVRVTLAGSMTPSATKSP